MEGLYSISMDDYTLSENFRGIHSDLHIESTAIERQINDEKSINKQNVEKLDNQINREYAKSEEDGQTFEQHEYNYENEVLETRDKSIKQSIFIQINTQTENYLKKIALQVKTMFNVSIDVEDYIKKCKKEKKTISTIDCLKSYIQKYSNIKVLDIEKEWSEIKNFTKVRNSFVHNGGKILNTQSELLQYINLTDKISLDEYDNQVILSYEYLIDGLNRNLKYLEKLMERVWANRPEKT